MMPCRICLIQGQYQVELCVKYASYHTSFGSSVQLREGGVAAMLDGVTGLCLMQERLY